MHVVGELQRRPSKKRHSSEKLMGSLYDVAVLVKYITFLILVATTTIAANRTFDSGFWNPSGYQLSSIPRYKFSSCHFTALRNMYAFQNVSMTVTQNNNAELLTDYAGQLRSLIILTGLTLVLGAINREIFRHNRFFVRWRHMYFHKDVVTTVEALLLAWIFYIAFHLTEQQTFLQDYFHGCNMTRTTYLPFVSITPSFVFIGVHAFTFVMAIGILLFNTWNSDTAKTSHNRRVGGAAGGGGGMGGTLTFGGPGIDRTAREPNDPTVVCHADLHEEPDDVNSLTDKGSEADSQQRRNPPYQFEPQSTLSAYRPGATTYHQQLQYNPQEEEEMHFAALTNGGGIPDAMYSHRSPTRARALTSPTATFGGNPAYPSQQRAYLQHRPQPLQRPASNRSSVYHYGREATPTSTMGNRRMNANNNGGSSSPAAAPSTLPRNTNAVPPSIAATTNAGSVPPPPPPHQSFYLYQQPAAAPSS